MCMLLRCHTCDPPVTKIQRECHRDFTPEIVLSRYSRHAMCKLFPFRLTPEAISDESLTERRPILGLVTVLQSSVSNHQKTKLRLTGQAVVKLVASGLPDSVSPSRVERNDRSFDVSPVSLLNLRHALVSERVIAAMLKYEALAAAPSPNHFNKPR